MAKVGHNDRKFNLTVRIHSINNLRRLFHESNVAKILAVIRDSFPKFVFADIPIT